MQARIDVLQSMWDRALSPAQMQLLWVQPLPEVNWVGRW